MLTLVQKCGRHRQERVFQTRSFAIYPATMRTLPANRLAQKQKGTLLQPLIHCRKYVQAVRRFPTAVQLTSHCHIAYLRAHSSREHDFPKSASRRFFRGRAGISREGGIDCICSNNFRSTDCTIRHGELSHERQEVCRFPPQSHVANSILRCTVGSNHNQSANHVELTVMQEGCLIPKSFHRIEEERHTSRIQRRN